MLTTSNNKQINDLYQSFYEELKSIKYDVTYNVEIFDGGHHLDCSESKLIQYMLINETTNEKLFGNLLFILSHMDSIIDKSNFTYTMTELYGILERYKIIKNIKKINDIKVYDFKKIYDIVKNYNFDVNISFKDKSLDVHSLDIHSLDFESNNILGFNDFYKYIGNYFQLCGMNYFNLYFNNKDTDNYIKPKAVSKLQNIINKSKKDDFCNTQIKV